MSVITRLKTVYRLLAWPAVVLSAAYLITTLWRQWDSITQETLNQLWWPGLPLSVALYFGTVAVTALGWGIWLRAAGEPIGFGVAGRTALVSGIGKYLPGNVGHFIGRAAMTVNAGISPSVVAFLLMVETLCIVAVGTVVATGALRFNLASLPLGSSAVTTALAGGLALAFTVVIGLSISKISGPLRRFIPFPPVRLSVRPIVLVMALYGACWVLHGASLWVLSPEIMAPFVNQPILLIGIVAGAWLAGFVVPGAPGGLGVREAILVLLLGPITGEAFAVTLALIQRLVSSIGDFLAFAVGMVIGKGSTDNSAGGKETCRSS